MVRSPFENFALNRWAEPGGHSFAIASPAPATAKGIAPWLDKSFSRSTKRELTCSSSETVWCEKQAERLIDPPNNNHCLTQVSYRGKAKTGIIPLAGAIYSEKQA
jgi:hypothetical protein